jgi:Mrp family chromosome partitioning ATPase
MVRIPRPPRRLRKNQRLVMLDDPEGPEAEAFRILRTNFELACMQSGARSVIVTSGVEQEGKTTTVANLASRSRGQAGASRSSISTSAARPCIASSTSRLNRVLWTSG